MGVADEPGGQIAVFRRLQLGLVASGLGVYTIRKSSLGSEFGLLTLPIRLLGAPMLTRKRVFPASLACLFHGYAFKSLTDHTITNLPFNANGSINNINGFGIIAQARDPRIMQLAVRVASDGVV